MIMKNISALPQTLAFASILLATACLNLNAQITADFSGGMGTTQPDQYVGTDGDGWARSWYSLTSSSNISIGGAIQTSDPVNGGGNYLQVTTNQTGNDGAQQNTSLGRKYTNYGDVSTTAAHQISFDLRIDSWTVGEANPGSQFIGIYGNTTGSMGNNFTNNSTWMIRVYAGNSGGATALTWAAYDGSRNGSGYNSSNLEDIGSGLTMEIGTTYSFTITNDPTTGSYMVSVSDGETVVSTADWLGYRTANWGEGYTDDLWTVWHEQTLNLNDGAEFSVDNISITAIPEASSFSFVGFALLGLLYFKRLKRTRR